MDARRTMFITLAVESGLLGVTLVGSILWLLLSALGDETGAHAARIVVMSSGMGVLGSQILLVHLLALGSLRVKMKDERRVRTPE